MASVNREKINTSTVLELLQTRAEYKPHFKNKECLQILPTSKDVLEKLKDLPEKKNQKNQKNPKNNKKTLSLKCLASFLGLDIL